MEQVISTSDHIHVLMISVNQHNEDVAFVCHHFKGIVQVESIVFTVKRVKKMQFANAISGLWEIVVVDILWLVRLES